MSESAKLILVIEDDRDIREALKDLLESEGYRVRLAINGRDALDYLESKGNELPSVILLDLMMPVMDGLGFCERRKRVPALRAIPVVIVSAGGTPQFPALLNEVEAFVKKPVDIDEILELVLRLGSAL